MSYDGTEGGTISYETAATYCQNYQDNHPGAVKGFYLGKDLIETILDQRDCVGIRVYMGEDSEGNEQLVWVGVDDNEDDMVNGVLADACIKCPPGCGSPNNLNNDSEQ